METANKEIVEKKTYVHDDKEKDYASKGVAGTGLGLGIAGTALGLLALSGNGRGLFGWGGGANMPENVNINTMGGAGAYGAAAPTAFQAWEKSCDEAIALTNAMWGLKVGSMQADYDHRNVDVAEKFSLYKSQVDADFGLYKVSRDLYDNTQDKMNAANFGLYKSQRDGFDALNARISQLEKEVAVGAAIRPYQDKLIQCEIEKAYTASINHTDRLDCRNIKGVITLPSTPTVTGFPSQCCGCRSAQGTATAPSA
jgi:hypothetical protein